MEPFASQSLNNAVLMPLHLGRNVGTDDARSRQISLSVFDTFVARSFRARRKLGRSHDRSEIVPQSNFSGKDISVVCLVQ
jgi:hypothetical protein